MVNTSTIVLHKHYIRHQTREQQRNIINTIETEILDSSKSRIIKHRVLSNLFSEFKINKHKLLNETQKRKSKRNKTESEEEQEDLESQLQKSKKK